MQDLLKKRHGSVRAGILNLILLALAGVVLIRLVAFSLYSVMPNSYFLQVESIEVTLVDACPPQKMQVSGVRRIYPYLSDKVNSTRAIEADLTIELFKANGRKVDDIKRNPVIEWKPGGASMTEWDFTTTLLPGQYYVVLTYYIELPYIGKKEEPIIVRSPLFTVDKCNK